MAMRMNQQDPKIHWDLEVLKTRITWQVYRNELLGILSREHSYL